MYVYSKLSEQFDVNHSIFSNNSRIDSLFIGEDIRIVFGQSSTIPDNTNIYLTIVGEKGLPIILSNNQPIKDLQLNYLGGVYYIDVNISPETVEQYVRLYFKSDNYTINPDYNPSDALLTKLDSKGQELVPLSYFLDYVMNNQNTSLIDPLYKKAVSNFVKGNPDGIRAYLRSAQYELENDTKLYFTERTISDEKRDYFFDKYTAHLWQFQVNNPPINSLEKFEIKYGNSPVAEISTNLFVWDRVEGLIEFLPVPYGDSAGIYSLVMQNLTGAGLVLLSGTALERIPALFRVTYKTGLVYDGCDPLEKESIRMAVCNRALINLLPKIDPAIRLGSYSEGIDGVSASRNYIVRDILREYKEYEKEFVLNLRRKYGRNIDMVIV